MNNDLPLPYNLLQRKINTNSQYLCYAGVSNEANGAMTSFPYNGEYWQNWKLLDCQQKASPDEMESEWQARNTTIGQKT